LFVVRRAVIHVLSIPSAKWAAIDRGQPLLLL